MVKIVKVGGYGRPRPRRRAFSQPLTTTITMVASGGSGTLTGEAAFCQIQEASAFGSVTLTGGAAIFLTQAPFAFGSLALSGETSTFQTEEVDAFGSFA